MKRLKRLDSVFTFPFLLWTLSGMLGDVNSSRDSCSHSFFLRRSMTFEPLLALWNQVKNLGCDQNHIFFPLSGEIFVKWWIHTTFSLWISLRRCEILTFMVSSSSSGTWGMWRGSVSSGPWKVSSVRGMYHLLSYCWFFLQREDNDEWWKASWARQI